MNLESIRQYCLKKKGRVTEEFPFDEETLAFKIEGKIFLITGIWDAPLKVNLKCDPILAVELRERYPAVSPGFHMNKKHWNTVTIDGSIPASEIRTMIDHSYEQVVATLPQSKRRPIGRQDKMTRAIVRWPGVCLLLFFQLFLCYTIISDEC